MKRPIFGKLPRILSEMLGSEGSSEYIDFVNYTWEEGGRMLRQESERRFEKRLSYETSKLREELSDLRQELNEFKNEMSEFKTEMSSFQTETRTEFSVIKSEIRQEITQVRIEMKNEFLEVYKELHKIHETISNQTKWILTTAVAVTVFLPIVNRLLQKFL
ncbi:hypothetical protein EHQ27_16605 [Leptospira wolffii]|uniref:LA_3696 family protein n=1 Tax=Leptospira wolffii TaxID=409998 RepID=UPI0002FCC64B|nr:hypothetical protein [Leptospira wolffii]TGK62216.1 hypothetical protein EHQ32_05120 [Leptospira wolffii]TGK66587.1 hypothetical protein EHQ27_16605 [Leptospira wolffii]TGK74400.1 hypothetical protein EHQ35_08655 [Leptospira wolffii]TGL32025.1 hypothetical protein EHQ57_04020 [Leptospira wolffii]